MINNASIRNFKCLRDVQIDLERFTVFVGPNASGKSSILQGLDLLCRSFHSDHPRNVEKELYEGMSRGATDAIELAGEVDGKWYRYVARTPSSQHEGRPIQLENSAEHGCGVAKRLDAPTWKRWAPEASGRSPLPHSVVLRLEASNLVQPNPVSPDPTVMAPDGAGLHSALASMALNDPDSWQALQADLRRIIPSIRRLRHTRTTQMHQPVELLFDTVGGNALPANQVSEGTLLVLGLLAVLRASDRPSLALLDDLDRGLHPKAQQELIALLRGLLETNPDLQIIATTHSPYLLDSMETHEVRMTLLQDDGATVCAALASHPQFEKWKDEMTPGEMWSLFGEKWLVEDEVTA